MYFEGGDPVSAQEYVTTDPEKIVDCEPTPLKVACGPLMSGDLKNNSKTLKFVPFNGFQPESFSRNFNNYQ